MNTKSQQWLFILASLSGMIGVIFGAFGAHFLKARITPESLDVIKTGVLYLFIHTLAIFVVLHWSTHSTQNRLLLAAGYMFILGILLFTGSLFVIGTSPLTGISGNLVGILTPFGGMCFITGWMMTALWGIKGKFRG